MAKRWPPILGVTGFDGGSKSAIALATRTGRLQGGEGEQVPDRGPGACCHTDGSCDELSELDCLASGGTWQGPGTTCDDVDCTGACCDDAGNCTPDTTQSDCEDGGGTFQGIGTTCDPNPCPTPGTCHGITACSVDFTFSYQDSPTFPIGHNFSGTLNVTFDVSDCDEIGLNSVNVTVHEEGVFGDCDCVPDAPVGGEVHAVYDSMTGFWTVTCELSMNIGATCTNCDGTGWPSGTPVSSSGSGTLTDAGGSVTMTSFPHGTFTATAFVTFS